MPEQRRDDLVEQVDELEETLDALRDELAPRRGPMGLPRPPRPRELLRFTDEYAIPTAIAALEANVRALELLRAGIRATDPERVAGDAGTAVRDRASGVGRASLERLDRALTDLESALEGSGLPQNREASDLLSEARRLNEEVRDRMESSGSTASEGAIKIDVESELETVKEAVESERREASDGADSDG